MGRILIIIGGIMLIAGLFLHYGGKIPWPGRLPGDIIIKNEGSRFYFPIVTCIILSVIFSLVIYIIQKLRG